MEDKLYTITLSESDANVIAGMLDKLRGIAAGDFAVSLFQTNPHERGEHWLWDMYFRKPYMSVADLIKLVDSVRETLVEELERVDRQRLADDLAAEEAIEEMEEEAETERKTAYIRPVMNVAHIFAANLKECE